MALQPKQIAAKDLKPGRHGDGRGLYLNVSNTGAKSWIYLFTIDGRRREMGLGRFPDLSLSRARDKADICRAQVAEGVDPIKYREEERARLARENITFADAVDIFLNRPGFKKRRADKTLKRWTYSLKHHCKALNKRRPNDIEPSDIIRTISGIWYENPPTGHKTRQFLERFFSWCKTEGLITGENPARYEWLRSGLDPIGDFHKVKHSPSLDWRHVPAFVNELRQRDAITARLLEFIILTGVRSGEARGLLWSEYRPEERLFEISAERMKMKEPHLVPLSGRAAAIVEEMKGVQLSKLVFTNPDKLREFTVNAPLMLLRRMGRPEISVHGFRTSFRTWGAEATNFDRAALELCLAHRVGGSVEKSYSRGPMLEKRRAIMKAWADHVESEGVAFLGKATSFN